MKKALFILTVFAITLASCAPQQRLARFLQHHPELQGTRIVEIHDTVIIHDTVTLEPETQTVNLTLNDILKMDSAATVLSAGDSITGSPSCTSEGVETNRSAAELAALGNGQFQLKTTAKPDTIIIHDTIPVTGQAEVPEYTTKIEYKDRIVYELKWWQKILCWLGAAFLALLLVKLGIFIAKKYAKPV